MSKHTPIPWRLGALCATTVFTGAGRLVGDFGGHSDNTADPLELLAEQEANACLFLVAPKMLAKLRGQKMFLQNLIGLHIVYPDVVDDQIAGLTALIAEADGDVTPEVRVRDAAPKMLAALKQIDSAFGIRDTYTALIVVRAAIAAAEGAQAPEGEKANG